MTSDPVNHADWSDSADGVAFALHPAHLTPGAGIARVPAFESARQPFTAYQGAPVAPPWVSPYRTLRWVLPQAERRMVLAPPEMPAIPAPVADPIEAMPQDEAPARPYATLPPPIEVWAPPTAPLEPYPPFAPPDPFDEPDAQPLPPRPPRGLSRRGKRLAVAAAGLLAAACVAAALIVPRLLTPGPITAVFTAPRLILRAAADGEVGTVGVKTGEDVQPDTTLLTIRRDPRPTPTTLALRAQLATTRTRAATLDAAMAQAPASAGDAGRLRQSEQQRLRKSAAAVIEQLQIALAANTPRPAPDSPIQAGVHGVVVSLDARPGASTSKNAPLVQLLDCGRAFLALQPSAALHAGQSVEVSLPPLPPFIGTIRTSAGVAEPANALVVAPTGLPAGACPVGRTATITPALIKPITSASR
jgi:hypothetical protein